MIQYQMCKSIPAALDFVSAQCKSPEKCLLKLRQWRITVTLAALPYLEGTVKNKPGGCQHSCEVFVTLFHNHIQSPNQIKHVQCKLTQCVVSCNKPSNQILLLPFLITG